MTLQRREFLHLAASAAVPAASAIARTQPYASSGETDITARLMGQWLSERLNQQFIIENRPGAGGNIDTETVVRASEFLPGYEADDWKGIVAPKNTPSEIIDKQTLDWPTQGAVCRVGLAGASRFPHRLRQAYRRRYRKVGQGGDVRGHQGGLLL